MASRSRASRRTLRRLRQLRARLSPSCQLHDCREGGAGVVDPLDQGGVDTLVTEVLHDLLAEAVAGHGRHEGDVMAHPCRSYRLVQPLATGRQIEGEGFGRHPHRRHRLGPELGVHHGSADHDDLPEPVVCWLLAGRGYRCVLGPEREHFAPHQLARQLGQCGRFHRAAQRPVAGRLRRLDLEGSVQVPPGTQQGGPAVGRADRMTARGPPADRSDSPGTSRRTPRAPARRRPRSAGNHRGSRARIPG